MATIKVELDAFYGYGHGGGCYGSNKTIEVEVNDHEFVAERVGLDLDACRDYEVDYTITIS